MTRAERGPVLALAAAETIVWAGFFYTFPILLLRWEADLGWGRDEVALAFTLSLVLSAVSAPLAGRVVDRGFGPVMLPAAALAGGALLLLLSFATTRTEFFLLWGLIGIASSFCLYEACFAWLTRMKGAEARPAITLVTLVAGFASTIAFPVADWAAEAAGWRVALRVFAAASIVLAAPLFLWSARRLAVGEPARLTREAGAEERAAARAARARPAFRLLFLALPCIALTHGMILSHLIPLLGSRGAEGAAAVFAASLIGPAQVAGRIAITVFARRAPALLLMTGAYVVAGLAYLLLLTASGGDWRIVAAILMIGAANGVNSIAKPLAIVERLGRRGYGEVAGALALPFIAGFAAAPFAAVLIWRVGGYDLVLGLSAALVALGVVLFLLASREPAAD
ncbi:MAG: MFS transporter [Pikeienuella sp.]|uniref:MFS transporter n=1 Tax=Pikeienuella sp. TaxID=2831957 RepID=UPI00391A0D6F